ncbi:MAG: protein-L-isoaspartate(D-aspartate) O-methyltransferase [Aquabacterium sp.]|jgi:protein-L-isoaspartate(D-aspartate) O-methyltransferase|nr:protein-L-isoaspartate(D-aspartate) O-methyltransferase [Aquabacterium sp.]MDX9844289.1 protein-L-isoaspartate(D-aspartate) O-methyltransferase [Aquabacterium sp.]
MSHNHQRAHDALLHEIEAEVRDTQDMTGRASLSKRVVQALRQVRREAFVPDDLQDSAYLNMPLPIGHRQTISQPYIVALMTELLEPQADQVVLEVGTGSGYQAAVLAGLVKHVYSVEVLPALAEQAKERLRRLGYHNVSVREGDGSEGWPEHAPYDAIIVTAAGPQVPLALIEQLKPGGVLVMPVGPSHFGQILRVIRKGAESQLDERDVLPVAFVPLTH